MNRATDEPVASWRPAREVPWPRVRTNGELDCARYEWLHTNGTGAYAMSTVALMHTRRYHGILVAALNPPFERHVVLSHAEMTVHAQERSYRLSTHQFPNVAPTLGYRLLQRFSQDPIPRWQYRIGKAEFDRTLCLVRGMNAVVLGYRWRGKTPATLTVRPLLPLRPVDELMREHGAMVQRVALRPGEVEIQPMLGLPPITFAHSGVFVGSPDWWRRFEYLQDRQLFADFQEDIWTPGTFDLPLEPDKWGYLVVSVGPLPSKPAAELEREAIDYLMAQDPGVDRSPVVRGLWVASDVFCVDSCSRPSIVDGYPWYHVRTRDALIALPGLLIARRKLDQAKRVLGTIVKLQHAGFLPETMLPTKKRARAAPDATLWLFEAARRLAAELGYADPFVRRTLYPALRRAFVRLRSGPRRFAWLTRDGLLANGSDTAALTWMDAHVGQWLVTPRRGLAVELQALWSRACRTLGEFARQYGDEPTRRASDQAHRLVTEAFKARFWCNETDYPFDCISEDRDTADAWADPSVRPNALIALAVEPELFRHWQAAAILARVRDELLTPRGIRTLATNDRNYRGHYEGGPEEREAAYHQGTAWPYLLGFYIRAAIQASPSDPELRLELQQLIEEAIDGAPVLGHLPQLADGDAPFRARGCPVQAWSIGMTLDALVTDLGL